TARSSPIQSNKGYFRTSRSGNSHSVGSGYQSNRSQNFSERKKVKNFGQNFSLLQKKVEVSDNNSESEIIEDLVNETILNEMSVQTPTCLQDSVTIWQDILDYDLAGRFKLSRSELDLLIGSRLELNVDVAQGSEKQLRVLLRSAFEENQLGLTTRNVIQLAIRQKLGPGYMLSFTSAT
ncbi:MAG TPA: hypothetical protein VH186_03980, partial [Chloroflexia bacterium]|nr:hypothetical protein [Chloroflexia bacterium]